MTMQKTQHYYKAFEVAMAIWDMVRANTPDATTVGESEAAMACDFLGFDVAEAGFKDETKEGVEQGYKLARQLADILLADSRVEG